MNLPNWEILKCECGSEQFLEVKRLKVHPTQGISMEPAGVKCEACGLTADMAYMTRRWEIERKKREIETAKAELKEYEGTISKEEPQNAVESAGQVQGKNDRKRKEDQIGRICKRV